MRSGAGIVAELWGRAGGGEVRDGLVHEEEGPPAVVMVVRLVLPLLLLLLRHEPPEEALVLQPRGLLIGCLRVDPYVCKSVSQSFACQRPVADGPWVWLGDLEHACRRTLSRSMGSSQGGVPRE